MVFYDLIYRAKMSKELDRVAERKDEELLQLHPVHCSFSTNSQVLQVTRLTSTEPHHSRRANAQTSVMSKCQPKAITWELQNSDKIRATAKPTTASKSECKQQCPQKNVSTEEQRNCSNSQNSLKESCGFEPVPPASIICKSSSKEKHYLWPELVSEFLF